MKTPNITAGGIEEIIKKSEVDFLGFAEIEQTKDKNEDYFLTVYVSNLDKSLNFPTKASGGHILTRLSKEFELRHYFLSETNLEHNTFIEKRIRKTKKYITGNLYRKKKKK